jgi:hypothetical protein
VYLNEEYVAAAGGTIRVILAAEEMKGVSVQVSANTQPGAKDGYFSYAVSYPQDVVSSSWELSNSSTTISGDLLDQAKDDDIALAPGYYLLRATLETSYSTAVRTEIVHIYPGLETRWDHAFVAADFGVPIAIRGTVNLTGLGPVTQAAIALFQDSDFSSYPETSFVANNPSGQWTWTARALPFNQPTDLYVRLRLTFPDGDVLTRRLPAPVSVYNTDVTAPNLGLSKVGTFELGGTFDFDNLTPLGITATAASVHIFYGGETLTPIPFGGGFTGEQGWSYELFGETNSPVRMVLKIDTNKGSFYSEIQKNLTGDLSSLEFEEGMISAGTTINGAGVAGGYSYLFEPGASGNYAFTVSSSQGAASLSSVTAVMGPAPSPSGPDVWGLSDTGLYLITLALASPNQTFQLRVDPAAQATLSGTVDFTGLLSTFDPAANVTVTAATITIYADNGAHTQLGAGAVTIEDGSWTGAAGFVGASTSAVLAITANLSNAQTVRHQEYLAISGDNDDLNFAPAAVGQNPVFRTTVYSGGSGGDNALLYVPARTGLYSFMASSVAGESMNIVPYDGGSLLPAASYPGDHGEAVAALVGGKPYRVVVSSPSSTFATYQFQARELPPVTLSGTFNFAGLAPLTSGNIYYTEIQVYDNSNIAQLESPVRVNSNGSWTAVMPPASGPRPVRIAASVHLRNGGQIDSNIATVLPGSTVATGSTAGNLNFAPASAPTGEFYPVTVYAGSNGTWLLWIPETAGEYVLDVERLDNKDPQMYLYNGSSSAGNLIAEDDDSGNNLNSRIHLSDFVEGRPYLVKVTEAHNGAGAFRFKATKVVAP